MRTPGPWSITGNGSIWGVDDAVIYADGFGVHQHQNAEFIVRACNSHDALLKAAKHALSVAEMCADIMKLTPEEDTVIPVLKSAIAKAEGK